MMPNVEPEMRQTEGVQQQGPDVRGPHLDSHRGGPEDPACRCLYTWGPAPRPSPPHLCTRSQALLTREAAGCVHAAQSHRHPGRECSEGAVLGPPLQPLWGQGSGFRGPGQLTWKCRKPDTKAVTPPGEVPTASLRLLRCLCARLCIHVQQACDQGAPSSSSPLRSAVPSSCTAFASAAVGPAHAGQGCTGSLVPRLQRGTGGLGTWF